MSAYLMGRVFYTDLPAHLKLTLLAMADHADDDGSRVTVGQARLAHKVGAGERTVRAHIAELRGLGYIEKVGRVGSHGQDRHRIAVEKLPTDEQIRLFQVPRPEAQRRTADLAARKADDTSTGSPTSLDRQPASAEPSVNRQKNHQSAARARDPVWDGFAEWLGTQPATKAERGKWNNAAKQLREIGVADSDEVVRRGGLYQRRYPGIAPTPMGLVAHWGELEATDSSPARSLRVAQMSDEQLAALGG